MSSCSSRVICDAILAIRPAGNQDHHQAAFLDKDRMTVDARYVTNMFLHQVDNFLHGDIRDCFADNHLSRFHVDLLSFYVG